MPVPTDALDRSLGFRIGFTRVNAPEAHENLNFRLNIPWLSGLAYEEIFPRVRALKSSDPQLALFQSGKLLLGCAQIPFLGGDLAQQTQHIYQVLLTACKGRQLYRIWNYVPRINAATSDLENYRAFCKGRSHAFETHYGPSYQRQLPSASAVGCEGDSLQIVFAAGETTPRHVENPEQVPAYRYPVEYGPRSPSFSRATVVSDIERPLVFISGTAAIKGHATIAPGTLSEQIDCTLDNLRLISRASGLGTSLGAKEGWRRHFKVYLRHEKDLSEAVAALEAQLFQPSDLVSYLKADICRATLNVEIEATLRGR